ncbi:MAG: sulfatase-like hydrolase/transferase [Gemmatimonadales bacterium]|nr:sulfatase-like hydrolase/transferase [Gemmatimonadales bacterium]
MDRRKFLQSMGGIVAVAALPRCGGRYTADRAPNILIIVADDLGYADLSVTGRRDYQTPVVDQIAREGALLSQAYSSAPVCTPSRVAFMTGRYPARYPAGLYEPLTTQDVGLEPHPATLARLLKNAGYATALVGKWHLGLLPQCHPLRHGFDEFYGFLGPGADYASHRDVQTRTLSYFQDGERPIHVNGYLTDLFTDRAIAFVSRPRPKPFFLSLQYNSPHWPWQAPGDPPYPDTLRVTAGGSPETYGRMVRSMDEGIGRVLDGLHRRGLERDTLVVFTSDNGGERFSHMGPFSEGKMTLWEGGIRVAAVARWPGVIPPGSHCAQVCATFDLAATAAALANARPDAAAPFDGIDLMPALRGGVPRARDLYWRLAQRRQQKALRSGNWKYLATAKDGEYLFDLQTDPGEKHDRKVERPEVLAELRDKYSQWERQMLTPIPLDTSGAQSRH